MKSRFITQVTALAWLITFAAVTPVLAAEDSLAPTNGAASLASLSGLSGLYRERIATIELEIRNETERRTTILNQLDATINELAALQHQSNAVTDTSPQLTDNLQQVSIELEALEGKIILNDELLEHLTAALEQQPHLSVWQAALGNPAFSKRHKLLATQQYLVHATQQQQHKLQTQRKMLDKRYQSIMEYNQGVSDSIGELQITANQLLERRTSLELQLTEISAEIVAKQDRITTLQQRALLMESNPIALHFAALRKKLKDPVAGKLIKEFSEPKAKGLLKWKGVLIEAPLGLPFNAVSDGVVVFADQLQGLGNVAIIDHGQGYMSLYGMAELLLVQKDQLLLAGDPVGTVGESVGTDASALYFEVRHNADALDPQDWLEMQQIAQKNGL